MAEENSYPPQAGGKKRGKGKPIIWGLILLAVTAAIGWGLYWIFIGRWYITTDDAYVHGDVIDLAPQEAGTVTAVNVARTQYVKRGELLIQLDSQDAKLALKQAEANLAQTARNVAQIYQQEKADFALVAERNAELQQARSDFSRAEQLAPYHGVSKQTLEHARIAVMKATAALQQSEHNLAAAQIATNGTTPADHPQIRRAEANVSKAWLALARTRILAPVSGYVAQRNVQVGEEASPASPLLAIVPLDSVYVEANFKETALSRLRVGQPATLVSSLYGSSVTYHGKVVGFSPGTGAAFSILPPENASGNWIKVVQRLPIRIGIDPKELKMHPLMLGLSMTVDVSIRTAQGEMLKRLPAFNGKSATDIYSNQIKGAAGEIRKILRENLPADDLEADHERTRRPADASSRATSHQK